MKITRSILCITAVAFVHVAFAQEPAFVSASAENDPQVTEAGPLEPNTYGTATLTRLYVPAPAFVGWGSGTEWAPGPGISRYAAGTLQAAVVLPAGASVEKIGIRACDLSATEQVQLYFQTCNSPAGFCDNAGFLLTGAPDIPGCGVFEVPLAVPLNVSATANRVTAFEVHTGNSSATRFDAAYIDYRLRISDPPLANSFTDVPMDHQFFQHIEALKASGITTGCTGTTFCPDQFVTRAQMAAFLARALGLHWAP